MICMPRFAKRGEQILGTLPAHNKPVDVIEANDVYAETAPSFSLEPSTTVSAACRQIARFTAASSPVSRRQAVLYMDTGHAHEVEIHADLRDCSMATAPTEDVRMLVDVTADKLPHPPRMIKKSVATSGYGSPTSPFKPFGRRARA